MTILRFLRRTIANYWHLVRTDEWPDDDSAGGW